MNDNLTRFYIVRHGETEMNRYKLVQGQLDSPLTEKGISQVEEVAQQFKTTHFDKVFSSDLLRAQKTAEIIVSEKKLVVETTKLLREQHYGKYEGTNRDEYFKRFDAWRTLSEEAKHTYKLEEDMESNEEAVSRLITFLREAALAYPGKTVLVVCHGAIMRYLAIHLGHIAYKDNKGFDNRGYMVLDSDGIDFFIKETVGIQVFD